MHKGKTILLGHRGRIGSRYAAILNYLGEEWIGFDICEGWDSSEWNGAWKTAERAIIATPTSEHYHHCRIACEAGVPFLCEKPLAKSLEYAERIANITEAHNIKGYVVNNYAFLARMCHWKSPSDGNIFYDYYNPGDDLEWSCAQLLHLDPGAKLRAASPYWTLWFGGTQATYPQVEVSYQHMIVSFLSGSNEFLWDLEHGVRMVRTVLERVEANARFSRSASEILGAKISGENLRVDRDEACA